MRTLWVALAGLCLGVVLALLAMKLTSTKPWETTQGEVHSAARDEILLMRTPGGLLEVSQIRATEVFDTTFIHEVFGVAIGQTVPRIRVPAVYRYQIELAREWRVLRTDEAFTVVAPAVRPSLPVAVDLSRLEKEVSGTWGLLPFTEDKALERLERQISGKLASKALLPAYLQMQREEARKTVAEFVKKWLMTQTQWSSSTQPRLQVLFEDEPAGTIEVLSPPRR